MQEGWDGLLLPAEASALRRPGQERERGWSRASCVSEVPYLPVVFQPRLSHAQPLGLQDYLSSAANGAQGLLQFGVQKTRVEACGPPLSQPPAPLGR